MPTEFPAVAGSAGVGVVEKVGSKVTDLKVKDVVYAIDPKIGWVDDGDTRNNSIKVVGARKSLVRARRS